MQVLKEEVRQRILKSARREFKKNGFEKVSMRSIASSANMTVGNLYRYYKNKEDLYGAIIGNLLEDFKPLKNNLPDDPKARLGYLLNCFKDFQNNHRSEWLTLFDGSAGTRFQKIAGEIHTMLKDAFTDVLKQNNRRTEIAIPLSAAVISGINAVLRFEKGKKGNLADDYLDYILANLT